MGEERRNEEMRLGAEGIAEEYEEQEDREEMRRIGGRID